MRVHRLEAVVDAQPVGPPGDRGVLVPGEDRRAVAADRLEVAAVLGVVGVVFEPVEGVAGDLQGEVVAGRPRRPCWRRRGRTPSRRRASRRRAAGRPCPRGRAIQWNPPDGPSRITRSRYSTPVAGVADDIRRGGPASSGRRPRPSRSSAPGRRGSGCRRAAADQSRAKFWWKPPRSRSSGAGIPAVRQLLLEQVVDLAAELAGLFGPARSAAGTAGRANDQHEHGSREKAVTGLAPVGGRLSVSWTCQRRRDPTGIAPIIPTSLGNGEGPRTTGGSRRVSRVRLRTRARSRRPRLSIRFASGPVAPIGTFVQHRCEVRTKSWNLIFLGTSPIEEKRLTSSSPNVSVRTL